TILVSDWSSDVCSSDLEGRRWGETSTVGARLREYVAALVLVTKRREMLAPRRRLDLHSIRRPVDRAARTVRRACDTHSVCIAVKIGRASCRERAQRRGG